MTKLGKFVGYLVASALISSLAVTAGFLAIFNSPAPAVQPAANEQQSGPVLPASSEIDYSYRITGSSSSLLVESLTPASETIYSRTVNEVAEDLDLQNDGRITEIIFGTESTPLNIGDNSTFTLSKGTYIIRGSITSNTHQNQIGTLHIASTATAYLNGSIENTAPNRFDAGHAAAVRLSSSGVLNIMQGSYGTIKIETANAVINVANGANIIACSTNFAIYNSFSSEGNATLNVYGGFITASTSSPIKVSYNSRINMYGGIISAESDTTCNAGNSSLYMYGGLIENTGSYEAVSTYSVLEMHGGEIKGTTARTIACTSSELTRITVTNGTISTTSGSAIYAGGEVRLTLSGGLIKSTTGTAINIKPSRKSVSSIINISGGTVSTTTGKAINSAPKYDTSSTNSTINISGGTISATTGNAIYLTDSKTTLTISDTANITAANSNSASGTIFVDNTAVSSDINLLGGRIENTATGTNIRGIYGPTSLVLKVALIWTGEEIYNFGSTVDVSARLATTLVGEIIAVSVSNGDNEELGAYVATASLTGPATVRFSYSIINNTFNYSVSLMADNNWVLPANLTYDGNTKSIDHGVATNELPTGATITLTYTLNGNPVAEIKNAGTYVATATLIGGQEYAIKNPTVTFDIQKMEVDAIWGDTSSFVYNKSQHSITATAVGVTADGTFNLTVSDGSNPLLSAWVLAGTYTATASIPAPYSANYTLRAATASQPFAIAQKPIDIAWVDATLVERDYDPAVTSDVSADLADSTQLEANDTTTVIVQNGKNTFADTYEAVATLSNPNYRASDATAKRTYVINPKPVTFDWGSIDTFVYNGQSRTPSATINGLFESDAGDENKVRVSVTALDTNQQTIDPINVGAYIATAGELEGTHSQNYYIDTTASSATLPFTITPKPLTVTFGAASFIYDGTQKTLVITLGGIVSGDSVTYTAQNHIQTNAGTYEVVVTGVEGTHAGNYKISHIPADDLKNSLVISPKEITIVWDGYANRAFDGQPSPLAVTPLGLIEADNVTVSIDDGENTNVGTHTAKAVLNGDKATNYIITTGKEQEYTITRASGGAAPTVVAQTITTTSIVVQEIAGAEYSIDGTNWQDNNVFNGLVADSIYTVYARIKATDNNEASAIGQANIQTEKNPLSSCLNITPTLSFGSGIGLLLPTLTLLCAAALLLLRKKSPKSKQN